MAIIKDGVATYVGCVLKVWEHYWMDGMTEEYAEVWDMGSHSFKNIQIGYYGSDFRNLMGSINCKVDATEEVYRDILRTIKRTDAVKAYVNSVTAAKTAINKGTRAEVVRGRKVKKGTILEVFWVGKKFNPFSHEDEMIAGAYDQEGNKVWIKAEYLKNIDPIKSPCAAERKKFIKAYVEHYAYTHGYHNHIGR